MIEQFATSASRSLLSQLPESPRHGTVHSVFSRAVNLQWGGDGWMCLLAPALPLNPRAVRLSELPTPERRESARVSRSEVVLPESRVRIPLGRAVPVDLRLLPVDSWDRRLVRSRTHELETLCPAMKTDPFGERIHSAVEQIRGVEDEEEVGRRLCSLVGLGNGLTPAGDDFLVGFLAASLFFGIGKITRRSLVSTLPGGARTRTTDVGRWMLSAAVTGEFAEPVHGLLQAVVRPGNGLRGRVRELLEIGASSGADILAGILFCLQKSGKGQP